MGPIVLLKNFTFELEVGQSFTTDWIPFPSEHKNADMHVHLQSIVPTGLTTGVNTQLQATYDTVEEASVGGGVNQNLPGSTTDNITSDLGPMARVRIANPESVAIFGIVSVWLQPKSD